jgi:hypothetical protein
VIKIFATLDGAQAPFDDHKPPRSLRFSTLFSFYKQRVSFYSACFAIIVVEKSTSK